MFATLKRLARRSVNGSAVRATGKVQPAMESLEERFLLYSASGNLWPHPELVTISFMPDGTDLGGLGSNLNSTFNSKPQLNGRWQGQILKAAQLWAQQTNINLAVVPDNGAAFGSGDYEQGDPGFGDIRIGGYAFGNSALAMGFKPPQVNNFSLGGDILFNTTQSFNIGTTFDLLTVATHEFGHALGLNHSGTAMGMMFPGYNGLKSALNSDDIAGIRNIYSGNNPRSNDAYDVAAANGTFATATNLSSLINPTSLTALVPNLDITTTSDIDDYTFVAPTGTTGTLTLKVQSAGLSQLSPKVTVYAADQTTVLGSANGLNLYGTTLTVSVSGVTAGQQFYVKVQGADTTAFSTGAYALTLNFGSGASPTVTPPVTITANGSPISGGGGEALSVQDHIIHDFPQGPLSFGIHGLKKHSHSKHRNS